MGGDSLDNASRFTDTMNLFEETNQIIYMLDNVIAVNETERGVCQWVGEHIQIANKVRIGFWAYIQA